MDGPDIWIWIAIRQSMSNHSSLPSNRPAVGVMHFEHKRFSKLLDLKLLFCKKDLYEMCADPGSKNIFYVCFQNLSIRFAVFAIIGRFPPS